MNADTNVIGTVITYISTYFEGLLDEKLLIDRIKIYADYRNKILEPIDNNFSSRCESSTVFQLVIWTGAIALISILFAQIRAITLFSLHPVCMILGSLICMAEGIVSYRNNMILSSFAPIMAGSKRHKRYALHRTLHIMGFAFILLGFLFILSNKVRNGFTVLPHTLHAFFGLAAILLAIFQGVVGSKKLETLVNTQTKTLRFHGGMGLLNWDVICISILLGFMEFLSLSVPLIYLVAVLIVLISWFNVHVQMRSKHDSHDRDKSSTVNLLTGTGTAAAAVDSKDEGNGDIDEEEGGIEATTGGLSISTSAGSVRDLTHSFQEREIQSSHFRSAGNSAANSDSEEAAV